MKKLFSKYHSHYTFDLDKPKSLVVGYILQQKEKKRSFLDKLTSVPIDFSEVSFTGKDRIEIKVRQTTLKPFKANGIIRIELSTGLDRIGTRLQAEIIPYYKSNIYGTFFIILFLALFAFFGLLISTNRLAIMIPFSFSFIFLLIIHLKVVNSRSQLKENLEDLVHELKRKATANIV
ncbi:hypothetical protein [Rufibacter tibetensis]|uniref:Uncharacterized protein n=1 Tax=Rufibacter tibetensis TaxID=512763 RepID=A0A0P0D3K3_9BACT|nr:hypothetical protein [Rufibacter tibetensis]ALJ01678.1 hypothetical protein DC20_21735 [Rufibacter tibetensis]